MGATTINLLMAFGIAAPSVIAAVAFYACDKKMRGPAGKDLPAPKL